MTPALALIITLQNAVVACESHAITSVATGTITYERGFEQCAYVVPEATKRINLFYTNTPAESLTIDKAAVEKAVAALAAHP